MKNHIKTIVLLGSLSAIIIGLGALVAPGYLVLFGALAIAMNLGAYFFSDRIVLRMHRAREVSPLEAPELHEMVEELSARADIPKPRLYVIPEDQPNAFATGRNPERGVVAVTTGIVRILDRRELRGVIAHELAHIKNRDILVSSVAAAAASVVTYVAQALSFGSLFGVGRDEGRARCAGDARGLHRRRRSVPATLFTGRSTSSSCSRSQGSSCSSSATKRCAPSKTYSCAGSRRSCRPRRSSMATSVLTMGRPKQAS